MQQNQILIYSQEPFHTYAERFFFMPSAQNRDKDLRVFTENGVKNLRILMPSKRTENFYDDAEHTGSRS